MKFRVAVTMVYAMALVGCVNPALKQAARDLETCNSVYKTSAQFENARSLVEVSNGQPSPMQLSNHTYPTPQGLEYIRPYWGGLYQCKVGLVEQIGQTSYASDPRFKELKSFLRASIGLQGDFLGGNMTYADYFSEVAANKQGADEGLARATEARAAASAAESARQRQIWADAHNKNSETIRNMDTDLGTITPYSSADRIDHSGGSTVQCKKSGDYSGQVYTFSTGVCPTGYLRQY